ncbi:fructosamine kinase family protein [Kribbella sp. NPDC056861]|uniref:fructosamine kinase family protein n=1 Tax=Kribbella sp. NPDC056861 TaxID=3154857 RepID=UPI00342DD70A
MPAAQFVKERPDAPPGFFEIEAAGLRWLAVPNGVPVVQPLDVSPGRLVLPRLEAAPPTAAAAEAFGRRLAITHAAGAAYFGVPPDGWTGDGYIGNAALPHPPAPVDSWAEFYVTYRLEPYLRLAYDSGAFDDRERALFDRVCRKVADEAPEPPSRIHGDLWSGNVLWTPDGVQLIDPAAHGGHRETDLAMLAVFGLPELERVLAAYDEAHPLAAGWRERAGLHQLHPLLVHVVLFGGSYVGQAVATAARYG